MDVASYAVVWREGGVSYAGKLELGRSELQLLGSRPGARRTRLSVPYGQILGVRIGRSASERLNGAPSVILDRQGGSALTIGALNGLGIVFELAEVLADLAARAAEATRIAIVVPISNCARARGLIAAGPPFELSELPAEHHEVFLTEHEAVFVFEGAGVRSALERLARNPRVWMSAAAWKDCLAGRPRVAQLEYSWTRR